MIELKNLTKKFDNFTAVDHIDLSIGTGEFFGLLGPNGAGKTTTISMLSTLLLPTEGEIHIDGELLTRNRQDIKQKVSVVTQEYSMRQDMDMDEIMEYQGRLYYLPRKVYKQKTEELLAFAGLTEHRHKIIRQLSGGQKRKLMICRALLTDPQIMLLDEPTAGMDAVARRQMWNLLRQLNEAGLTIILTTHYIEEAQNLCDRIALMTNGHIEEVNTPQYFIDQLGKYAVDQTSNTGLKSRYFATREEAMAYLSTLDGQCTLRDSNLEDVFVVRVGQSLEASRHSGGPKGRKRSS